MSNVRNSRTTHPRKAARRARAFGRLNVIKGGDKSYIERKRQEFMALGGDASEFASICARRGY